MSNKRPSPQHVPLPDGSPPAVVRGRASYVTQTITPTSKPVIHHEFERNTGTWQYIVADTNSNRAAIIDPILDYDPATQLISTTAADALLSLIKDKGLTIDWILETHAHADHLTASSYLQVQLAHIQGGRKPPVGIGRRIDQVQGLFGERYGIAADEYTNVFDKLFDDDETFSIGGLEASVVHLPGHTPDHLGYKIGGTYKQPRWSIRPFKFPSLTCGHPSQTTSFAGTPFSTPTLAQPDAISQEAALRICGPQPESYSACQTTSRSGLATITRLRGAVTQFLT